MIDRFLNLIFPKNCLNCGKQGEGYLCSSCFCALHLKFKILSVKNRCYDYIVYLNKYEKDTRIKLLKFKFNDKAYINEYFISFLAKDKRILEFLKGFDIIIPVPMNRKKELRRGYNQAELLAKSLSRVTNIKCNNEILVKLKNTKTQSLLNKDERLKNLKGAFGIKNQDKIYGKNVVIVDDIFTTGATVDTCSSLLKKAGAKYICVLVVAKGK